MNPKDTLLDGVQILEPILLSSHFTFQLRGDGTGSGGRFAWGEFTKADRRLELHVRFNLGCVRYHVGGESASHECYMRELGKQEQCLYPSFSDDPMIAFRGLARDLAFADDFLNGSGIILRQAAAKESVEAASRLEAEMASYAGDKRTLEELRNRFREKRYREVVTLAERLKFPDRMTQSEQKMIELAKARL